MSDANKVNYALAAANGISFVLSALTGAVLLLLNQAVPGDGRAILGLSRGSWSDLHTGVSLVLVIGVVVHLVRHRNWIASMARSRAGGRSGKTRLNNALDLVIGIVAILSLLTGLASLQPGSGGYRGGWNPGFQAAIAGRGQQALTDLHTWFSLALIAGIGAHLALHWGWIVCMTRRLLRPRGPSAQEPDTGPGEAAAYQNEA